MKDFRVVTYLDKEDVLVRANAMTTTDDGKLEFYVITTGPHDSLCAAFAPGEWRHVVEEDAE